MVTPPAEKFLEQLENLKVVSRCACGCASIDFVDAPDGFEVISEAEFRNQDGGLIGVLVFASRDKLATLETYSNDGSRVGKEIPHPNRLTLWSSLEYLYLAASCRSRVNLLNDCC